MQFNRLLMMIIGTINDEMFNVMKMSKYNFTAYDYESNLIIYNFLSGPQSLTKVMKPDVEKFRNIFFSDANIRCSDFEEPNIINWLQKAGILVDSKIDESNFVNSFIYENVFNSELVLTILPTGKCNFKCPYCYESAKSFYREAMTIDAQKALVKFVQKRISEYKSLRISWFGGEPLLESNTIKNLSEKFIQICNARFLPYSAEITTNGFLLNPNMFDSLYQLKVYNYQITIDGPKDRHDKYRIKHNGEGTYDMIVSNLLKIRDNAKYKFAHIVIRVNVTKDLFPGLDDFIDFLASSFGDDPRFEVVFMPVANLSNETNFELKNDIITGDQLNSKLTNSKAYMDKIYNERKSKISLIMPKRVCVAARKNAYVITPDLSVYKCCVHFDHDTNKIGYIKQSGDLEIDENLHKRWYTLKDISPSCNSCLYLPICNFQSCPIRKYSTQDNFNCSIEDNDFVNKILESVLYLAETHGCEQISFDSERTIKI